jgi:alkyl hydroperoxide reductase subunit F
VILSTGARWRNINVPGEKEFKNKGVAYCPHCDGPLFKGKRVAVVGGGNSGVEAAIDLAGIVGHVTLIEFDNQLRADEVLQRKLRSLKNVDVSPTRRPPRSPATRRSTAWSTRTARAANCTPWRSKACSCRSAWCPTPSGSRARSSCRSTARSWSTPRGQTSVPGVFAAGDATTVPFKQIIIAAGDGAKAALGAFDHLIRTPAPAEKAEEALAVA